MAGSWRIVTHPEGEWIIESEGGRWAVSPDLGRALLPLAGRDPDREAIRHQLVHSGWTAARSDQAAENLSRGLAKILAGPGARRGRPGSRAVWLRLPLLPARITERIAGGLRGLASTPSLVGLILVGGGLYLVATLGGHLTGPQGPADIGLGLGLFFLLALFHEFGHAAALSREGYPPGGIGFGILFVIPVLYADVSAIAVLPRRGKLRVDLAGVCFQLGAGGVLLAAGTLNPHLAGHGAFQLAGLLVLPAVAWSLLPFIRADGYWFLSDLLGLASLEHPAPPGRSRLLRSFLIMHRLANAAFLILVSVALPVRYFGYLSVLCRKIGVPLPVPLSLLAIFLVTMWWGLGRRLILLWCSCRNDLSHFHER